MKLEPVSDIDIETIREDIKLFLLGFDKEPTDEELGSMTGKVIVALNDTFEAIKSVKANDWILDEEADMRTAYIGTIFALAPSGKYYIEGLTSNQTIEDMAMDNAYNRIIDDRDIHLVASEGCPTDVIVESWRDEGDISEEDNDDWKDEPRDKDYNDYTEEDNEFWRNINKGEE